ncbi:MAG: DUF11 domain-containing protein [Planctomycetota bacterium]|nr:MAG: DUF11 domain-containing protein [Planctomycetota bacterium]REK46697.1 MAG: DUF11 domain-containing protein [Planctomycetota bacterium]
MMRAPRFYVSVFLICALLVGCRSRSFYSPAPPAALSGAPTATLPTVPTFAAPGLAPTGTAFDPLAPVLPGTPPVNVAPPGGVRTPLPPVVGDPTAPALPAAPVAPVVPAPAAAPSLPVAPGVAPFFGAGIPVAAAGPPLSAPPVIAPTISSASLTVSPSRIVAPVGSEVVLLATVTAADGRPAIDERVEWMLSPDSSGQLIAVGERGGWRWLRKLHDAPRKIDNRYAISATSTRGSTLRRGTGMIADDVAIGPGQTWVSLSSPTDGVSHVTAFAPSVDNWGARQQSAAIYWIDAQFSFPAPAIAPVGTRQPLTTSVVRVSDGSPVEGWIVRYEITSSDGAALAPDGSRAVEVLTSAEGTATVEVYQQQSTSATTQVAMQLIRPGLPGRPGDRRLAIGSGATTITWTAAEAALRVTGPSRSEVGATAKFRIEVANPGGLPVDGATVTAQLPRDMTFQRSNRQANQAGGGLQWQLGTLAPGSSTTIEVDFRCERAGMSEFCAELTSSSGPAARECAAVDVAATAALDVVISGPATASIGDEITYNIRLTNRGATDITGLEVLDTFDDGLEHVGSPVGSRQLTSGRMETLRAGTTNDQLNLTFRVAKAGNLCQTIAVRIDGSTVKEERKCVMVSEGPATVAPGLDVNSAGPRTRKIGEMARFETRLRNTGDVTLENVRIEIDFEPTLLPRKASGGFSREAGRLVWRIGRFTVGQTEEILIDAECLDLDENACMNVNVVADPNVVVTSQACVSIEVPAPGNGLGGPLDGGPNGGFDPGPGGGLVAEILEFDDEVPVGGEITYEVRIRNNSGAADNNVVLEIVVPAGLAPLRVEQAPSVNHTIDGQRIRFAPVQVIRGRSEEDQDVLAYRIVLRANKPGSYRVEALVRSDRETTPRVVQSDTTVFGN